MQSIGLDINEWNVFGGRPLDNEFHALITKILNLFGRPPFKAY